MKKACEEIRDYVATRLRQRSRTLFVLILTGMVMLFPASASPATGKVIQAGGTMTAVETDGSVVINGKGYEVAYSARVVDWSGYSASLSGFSLPARVYFEYELTNRGAVIELIKEIPQ